MKAYPLATAPTVEELTTLGHHKARGRKVTPMAVPTGEVREPRQGEWYFSGPVAHAVRAAKDLTCRVSIARLVPQL